MKNCEVKNAPAASQTAPDSSLISAVNVCDEFANKGLLTLLELIASCSTSLIILLFFKIFPVGIIVPTVAAAPSPPVPPSTKSNLSPTQYPSPASTILKPLRISSTRAVTSPLASAPPPETNCILSPIS